MSAPPTVRVRLYRWGLHGFGRLPAPVRRRLVRLGTPSFTVGAVCLVEYEGTVLMLRQPHRTGWSLPGGLLDRGEGPAAAVVRELREETGLAVRVGLPIATVVVPGVRRVDVIYRIRVDRRPEVVCGGEALRAEWLAPDDVLRDCDDPTRDILAAAARADAPQAHDGEAVDGG